MTGRGSREWERKRSRRQFSWLKMLPCYSSCQDLVCLVQTSKRSCRNHSRLLFFLPQFGFSSYVIRQAGSFDLEKLATLQRLADAGNSTNSTESQPRLSIFNKWYWTPDNTEYLEKQHGVRFLLSRRCCIRCLPDEIGIAVDQWPWEACKGIDCKPGAIFAKGTREWERGVAQKLRVFAMTLSGTAIFIFIFVSSCAPCSCPS